MHKNYKKPTFNIQIEAKYPLYLKGFEDARIENIIIEDAVLNGVGGDSVLQNIKGLTFKNVSINGEKLEDKTVDVDNDMKIHTL